MTTDRNRVVKHLKLNSLSLAKPDGLSSRRYIQNDSEEEMTQMSCGMNLRETFREGESVQNGGNLCSTQVMPRNH